MADASHFEGTYSALEPNPQVRTRPRMHKRTATGFVPESGQSLSDVYPPTADADAWKHAREKLATTQTFDKSAIETTIVGHIYSSLARAPYNVDTLSMYQAVALSTRDHLLRKWNTTQTYHTQVSPKRVYYLSLEFLQGKALDNALINLNAKSEYTESIKELGFNMEDVLDSERDAGLGNGGLGRLAACYMDSLSTQCLPGWGYGLRYEYGIFQQTINKETGEQVEVPDPWLANSNPWEVVRLDAAVEVRFYGSAERDLDGKGKGKWDGGQVILAVPHDMPIPGYKVDNCNNIRFWSARPRRAFDLQSFNAGNYDQAVAEANQAELITRVLYPNDNSAEGKELRLKQQYFWCSASLSDICRRFAKIGKPWSHFPDYVAIQLNDTHPTLAIPELMRVLVDLENVPWDEAWSITRRTFAYTNHTVLPEALEKWPVPVLSHLLPRIMQIIFDINLFHLQEVEKKYPNDRDKLTRMSIIEEAYPQQVRMAFLAVIGSHKVNGVAEIHSGLVKEMFKDFAQLYGPDHFTNVTNGITFRRWCLEANPSLAALITKTLGGDEWLTKSNLLKGLEKYAEDANFQRAFYDCKLANKERLAHYIETSQGRKINRDALFDIQVKRIHQYKRQTMNIFGAIFRYLQLKKLSPEDRKKVVPRVSIFGGKAAPGYYRAKLDIRLINAVGNVVDADQDIDKNLFQVCFLPDYSVSLAEIITPASDISEHISTAGTEASGTSNMKFALNGGLILGTVDGANIEIAEEVGDEQIFLFGNLTPSIEQLRHDHIYHPAPLVPELQLVVDEIRKGTFGDAHIYQPIIDDLTVGHDYYCINDDFQSYLAAQQLIDQSFLDKKSWIKKAVLSTARMGKFNSDRAVLQYAEEVWNVEPSPVKKGF